MNKLEAVENETELRKLEAKVQDPVNEVGQVSDSSPIENIKVDEQKQVTMESKVKPLVKSQGPSVAEINSLLSQFKIDPELMKDNRSKLGSRNSLENRGSLFSGTPLNIFTNMKLETSESTGQMTTWKKLNERELELSIARPPTNGFEQMIQWTRQGKLWQFPINNEQGNVVLGVK